MEKVFRVRVKRTVVQEAWIEVRTDNVDSAAERAMREVRADAWNSYAPAIEWETMSGCEQHSLVAVVTPQPEVA